MGNGGYPTGPLDIPALVIALFTVPGHRFQDSKLSINLILDEARQALLTNEEAEFGIGNYTFTFTRGEQTDGQDN